MSQVWTARISHPSKAAASISMSRSNSLEEIASLTASAPSPNLHSRQPSLDVAAKEILSAHALKPPHPVSSVSARAIIGRGTAATGLGNTPSEGSSSLSADTLSKSRPAHSPGIGNALSGSLSGVSTHTDSKAEPIQLLAIKAQTMQSQTSPPSNIPPSETSMLSNGLRQQGCNPKASGAMLKGNREEVAADKTQMSDSLTSKGSTIPALKDVNVQAVTKAQRVSPEDQDVKGSKAGLPEQKVNQPHVG